MFLVNKIKPYLLEAWLFIQFYLLWIIIHFIVANLYSYVCTPVSLWGFFASPLLTISPHCKGIYWILNVSVNTIQHMWIIFGIWITSKLTGLFKGIEHTIQRQEHQPWISGHNTLGRCANEGTGWQTTERGAG